MRKKTIKVKAFADVGSHGGIFSFDVGGGGNAYRGKMHIYNGTETSANLTPFTLSYSLPNRTKKGRGKKI